MSEFQVKYVHFLLGGVNLNDFEKPIAKEFHYDVQFEGIDVVLVQDGNEFIDLGLTGNAPYTHILKVFLYSFDFKLKDQFTSTF